MSNIDLSGQATICLIAALIQAHGGEVFLPDDILQHGVEGSSIAIDIDNQREGLVLSLVKESGDQR